MPKAVAPPLAVETINEATLENDTAKRTLDALRSLPITPANMEMVGGILIGVKQRLNELEARQKAITAPMRAAEKAVRDLFRPGLNALAEAEAILKKGIADAQRAQFEANRAATQQVQAALQQGNALVAARAATALTHVEAPAGITTRDVWTFRVVDPQLVPRAFCVPDDQLIRAAIRAGIREIAGVVIEGDMQVTVRT